MEWELEKTVDVKVRATGKTGNLFHDWIFFFSYHWIKTYQVNLAG